MPILLPLNTIIPRKQEFLWEPYIPVNSATLVFGQGGIGKSYVTCDLAARMSNGAPWPGENNTRKPEKVLMLSAEDDFETALVPRLLLQGANIDNIFSTSFPFTLDRMGLEALRGYIRECGAKLVVIDPIVHYMGGKVDINKANEVRSVMGELQQIAQNEEVTLVIVHHIRKGADGDDWERVIGSGDFYNAVRSALFVHTNNEGAKIVSHAKSQYGKKGATRCFAIAEGILWGEEYDETGDVRPTRGRKREEAKAALRGLLTEGSLPATVAMARMFELGYAEASVNRAKPGLVRSVLRYDSVTKERGWHWELVNEPKRDHVAEAAQLLKEMEADRDGK
jgi:DNA repair protein RadA/Sms